MYFPLQSWHDLVHMDKKDRNTLASWINAFYDEMIFTPYTRRKQGRLDWSFTLLEQLSQEEFDTLKEKLSSNRSLNELESETVMQMLNIVLYRHKYNALISLFICPALRSL